jgi:hypothetical protein
MRAQSVKTNRLPQTVFRLALRGSSALVMEVQTAFSKFNTGVL